MSWSVTQRQRSGRTYRLLNEADRQAATGVYVFVVAASMEHRDLLIRRFLELHAVQGKQADQNTRLCHDKVYHRGGQILFCVPVQQLEWETLRMLNAHRSCVVLVDHWAIETRFAPMLEMLHRFDE